MVDIILITPVGRDAAEATPENAIYAARTLWDEAIEFNSTQGFRRKMMLVLAVGGKAVRVFEGMCP